ncbi:GDSL-type esterase/lipase family protein [Streptomyces sp. WI04-05B]|uniref:GDSL-type esterase/lipase family protein n=1 Tax=Streptomyces TaxID=1883 RepID=UPI0029B3BA83|nr:MULTISPECIES: GDSL-type esterase/lipase family protein [unclassified Streptomyces]MDX2545252.1 GDSL-type esterase/lipase family protein [Streptomyces sp. WI04-05B]MDX2587366.1 GDSL-type esterase/lipase family protein [Streptomyces sp. WI04-05A]MDX3750903.1 GDSL-type esterase/lipase family protein [Streptomyces sp. AK08-02]
MLRLMPVGDSMTIGSAGEHTWRYRLWQHLRETYGGPFRIVGPREALYDKATDTADSYEYADPDFPRAHLAGWGEGWQHMTPLIADAVRAHKPDVLLVSLGLIDLGFYTDAEQTAENTRLFVAEARRSNPRIAIALLPVIPNVRAQTDPPFAAQVTRFNELLAKTAADLDEPRSPLLLASPPPSYDINHDTYDGTHPNASGEHKIAGAFADSLYEAWDLGERYGAETS